MSQKTRIEYIDQFRGVVGILMLLGHSSYYFNSVWRSLEPEDPLFGSFGQFVLRYLGYLCAPGFLMMNGAMVWHSYTRRRAAGEADWKARWHLIQRGIFLVIVQMTWVNSSWGGFRDFNPGHIGIIATIGISMILLTFIVAATLNYSRWGYEVRIAGSNPSAAKYAGMPFRRHLITVMLLSGAIAGVAGMLEVAGTVHRLQGGISNNFGYLGIMVAVLARGSALGVLAGAALMGVILNSGIILQTQGVNVSTVLAITGLILFFTAIGDEAAHYRITRAEPANG